MALWLVRSGSHGEFEKQFLADKKVYSQWSDLDSDLSGIADPNAMFALFRETYPGEGEDRLWAWARQAWAFAKRMEVNDWIVMPSKLRAAIHFAKITGKYAYKKNAPDRLQHEREVEWFAIDVPRSNFDQDILYSFGAFLTVCQIRRNDAEARVKAMAANAWKSTLGTTNRSTAAVGDDTAGVVTDIEEIARDAIAKLVIGRFQGHGLARLVEALLQALGFTTYLSPEGPDKGIDILAAPDALGFGKPRICVQVKSGDTPVDAGTLNQLIGTMQNVQADQGLLVSWSGFKSSVDKEEAIQFFRVRLWDQDDLISNLLENYDKLDEEFRSELPLKRVWTVTRSEAND